MFCIFGKSIRKWLNQLIKNKIDKNSDYNYCRRSEKGQRPKGGFYRLCMRDCESVGAAFLTAVAWPPGVCRRAIVGQSLRSADRSSVFLGSFVRRRPRQDGAVARCSGWAATCCPDNNFWLMILFGNLIDHKHINNVRTMKKINFSLKLILKEKLDAKQYNICVYVRMRACVYTHTCWKIKIGPRIFYIENLIGEKTMEHCSKKIIH